MLDLNDTERVPEWDALPPQSSPALSKMIGPPQVLAIEPCQHPGKARLRVERHIVISHAELIAQPLRDSEMPAM